MLSEIGVEDPQALLADPETAGLFDIVAAVMPAIGVSWISTGSASSSATIWANSKSGRNETEIVLLGSDSQSA